MPAGVLNVKRVVYRPVGAANVKLYCDALRNNRFSFQEILHGMQCQSTSIEQGLQQLMDVVVA
jgi:hypothetical protein